ncbi:MAG: hypothetical protein ACO3AC_12075 [Hylemonella sp.]
MKPSGSARLQVHIFSAGAARVWIEHTLSAPDWSDRANYPARYAALQSTLTEVNRCLSQQLPCHLTVLTPDAARTLQASWPDRVECLGSLGRAATGWVVLANDPQHYDISSPAALSQTLRGLGVLLVPDLQASSGGRHLDQVLHQLQLAEGGIQSMRSFPGGAQAVAALAAHAGTRVMACAQSTEIQDADHARYLGPFPAPYGLSTEYVVVLVRPLSGPLAAQDVAGFELARKVGLYLCDPRLHAQRRQLGFE